MPKITIVGAGNVGASACSWITAFNLADVVLIDKNAGLAKGKAMDISDAMRIFNSNRKITGTDDFSMAEGSEIIVITAGLARKPGMKREDLLSANAQIIKSISDNIKKYVSEDTLWICVTNPLDIMTLLLYKYGGIAKDRLFGMGVNLDSARMANIAAEETNMPRVNFSPIVLGAHGKDMFPVAGSLSVFGFNVLDEKETEKILVRTSNRGAEIVEAFGSGSAYFAPGAAIYQLAKAILNNENVIIPASVIVKDELDLAEESAIGMPVRVGGSGWAIENSIKFDSDVKQSLQKAAQEVSKSLSIIL